MFREMRRIKQAVDKEECVAVMQDEKRGVLSFVGDDGYPCGIPMDFCYDADENKIYFHCGKEGHKIDSFKKCDKACFTVYNQGFIKEGDWAYNSTSVISYGRIVFLEKNDSNEYYELLLKLGNKYYPNEEDVEIEINQAIDRVQILCLEIEHMTGKLVNEK